MGMITPSYALVHPSYMIPDFIVNYQQASGYTELLSTGNPMVRLGEGDLYVYAKTLDIRTKLAASQSAANQLPSVDISTGLISTPTYLCRTRAEYDHHDTAAAGQWGLSIVDAYTKGNDQAFFQQFRASGLYGFNAANGEGVVNTAGSTATNLPTDPYSHDTVVTYDNGYMAFFLAQQIQLLLTRCNQMGIPDLKITILGPQRTLGLFAWAIVQLTQAQRIGAGALSTTQTLEMIGEWNDVDIGITYDDTLIGQGVPNGNGATDLVLIVLPELKRPGGHEIDTNEFAKVTPNLEACVVQLCDMIRPRQIPTPIPGGGIDVTYEARMTPGWGLRGEAITQISMQYQ